MGPPKRCTRSLNQSEGWNGLLHAFGFVVPMHMFAALGRVSGGRDFISGPNYGSALCVFDEISEHAAEEAGRQHFHFVCMIPRVSGRFSWLRNSTYDKLMLYRRTLVGVSLLLGSMRLDSHLEFKRFYKEP